MFLYYKLYMPGPVNVVLLPSSGIEAASQPGGFLQSRFWAHFKSLFGWSNRRFRIHVEGYAETEISVLIRKLAGVFTFGYLPHGPDMDIPSERQQEVVAALGRVLKNSLPSSCLFLRFDPAWYSVSSEDDPSPTRPEFSLPLFKASDVQPPDTVVVDLSPSEDEILARMKPKWRYNIKLAEKKQVTIADETSGGLEVFYHLYKLTAARDKITVHPKTYYEKLFELADSYTQAESMPSRDNGSTPRATEGGTALAPSPDLRLWVARHDGQALAAIITLFFGPTATYLYGASSDEKRNLMPAYALQWAAIKAAKAAGCSEYDLYGIPPVFDEQHPMAGLYRFKTGFGGELRHYPGAWDCVYRPFFYAAFRLLERLRLLWYKRLRKMQR